MEITMGIFTNTYRQTWKAGLVIGCAALACALLTVRTGDNATHATVQSTKTTRSPQPLFGSNIWFDLRAPDAAKITD
jgi:hypothetical protein